MSPTQITRRRFAAMGTVAGIALCKLGTQVRAEEMDMPFEIRKSDEDWQAQLTSEQYRVLRKQGTERAFTSPLNKNHAAGTYLCAGCEQPLFMSETKYDSGTGWPSFFKPIDGAIGSATDTSWFATRTEVHCRRCGGHLGHVFEDGPQPTGLRYCMNGVALKFVARAKA